VAPLEKLMGSHVQQQGLWIERASSEAQPEQGVCVDRLDFKRRHGRMNAAALLQLLLLRYGVAAVALHSLRASCSIRP